MSPVKNETAVSIVAGLALLLSLLAMAGCQRSKGNAASLPTGQGNSAAASGRTVFAAKGCARCHAMGGQDGHMGPDLAHVGARYTIDGLIAQVTNPRARNPSSRMPPFQGSPKDLMALGGYLASLK